MLYQEPQAARSGILAALLAREGASGAETALEGEAGFYNAFTGNYSGELSYVFHGGSRQVELASVVADLGSRWELMHVTPKIYPTAGFNCPVIELMTAMRAERDMPAAEIERITIEMNWLETSYPSPAFTAPRRPRAGPGSTAYIAAHTCIHGDYPSLAWQRPTAADPAVLELVDRVEVVGYEDRPAFAPRITVRMLDGTEHRGELQGDELEWDFATEVRRITALFDEIPWPRERLDDLVDAVSSIEALPSIDAIVRLLVPPAQNSE
jgi:2-methylcitrate dehydratase PrpD